MNTVPMPDVQSSPDTRHIAINKVGIKSIRHPVLVADRSGGIQHTVGVFNMYVHLPHNFKGTHMSRFVEILNSHDREISVESFEAIVREMCERLEAQSGYLEMSFPYFVNKTAPVSGVQSLFSRLAGYELGAPEFIITGDDQRYRRVCRLAIKYDKKARRAQVGFRRRLSHDLVEVSACPVLVSSLSALIEPLRALCNQLKSFRDLGHIELCEADNGPLMLLRHNGQPGEGDLALLREFAGKVRPQPQQDLLTLNLLLRDSEPPLPSDATLDLCRQLKLPADIYTYTTLISRSQHAHERQRLLGDMRAAGLQPNVVTFNSLIEKAASEAERQRLLGDMRAAGLTPDLVIFNSVIKRASGLAAAEALLAELLAAGLLPDNYTLSALLRHAPNYATGRRLFTQCRQAGLRRPNDHVWRGLQRLARSADEQADLASLQESI